MGIWHGWTLRLRLTALAGVSVSLFAIAFATTNIYLFEYFSAKFVLNQVTTVAQRVASISATRLPSTPLPTISYVQVVDGQGRVLAASQELQGKPPMAGFEPPAAGQVSHEVCDSVAYPSKCLIVVARHVDPPHQDWTVYAAAPAEYIPPLIPPIVIGGSALLIALATYITYRAVSRTLAPVEAIRHELAEITVSDLGRRVPLPKDETEIRDLARTANQTLDRLETVVERQRRFASDASHDLRSPLTAMRTQLEDALLAPEEANWPATAGALLESLDRLQAIVTDLLMIARLDAGAKQAEDIVDMSEMVRAELAHRTHKVRIIERLEPGVTVIGDLLRLTRLFTNLLDNAERHAASTITVTVRREPGFCLLEVLDDGAGIPPAQREIVFQRFTRLDAARSRDTGGTGLGLSIARQIAEMHRGTLTLEDSPKGARFVLRIPSPDSPSDEGR